MKLITVFILGDEHPVTVQPYAVLVKLYFRIEWIVDPKCYQSIFFVKGNCYLCCMIFDIIDLTFQNYFVEVACI